MITRKLLVTAIALVAIAADVHAADWQELGPTKGKSRNGPPVHGKVSLDVSSVIKEGPYVRALSRAVYDTPVYSSQHSVEYLSVTALFYFSCSERTKWEAQESMYDAQGQIVFSGSRPLGQAEFDDVPADTNAEAALITACEIAAKGKPKS